MAKKERRIYIFNNIFIVGDDDINEYNWKYDKINILNVHFCLIRL